MQISNVARLMLVVWLLGAFHGLARGQTSTADLYSTLTAQGAAGGWIDQQEADGPVDGLFARSPAVSVTALISEEFQPYVKPPTHKVTRVILSVYARYNSNTSNNNVQWRVSAPGFFDQSDFPVRNTGGWSQGAGDTSFRWVDFEITNQLLFGETTPIDWAGNGEGIVNALKCRVRKVTADDGRGPLRIDAFNLRVISEFDPLGNADGDPALNGDDCSPEDPTRWRTTAYRDADNDNLADGPLRSDAPCFGNTPPAGWTLNSERDLCVGVTSSNNNDFDGDSVGDICDNDIDGDGFLNANDCDDFNDTRWRTTAYRDADNDGLADGPLRSDAPCFGNTPPAGWTLNSEQDLCVGVTSTNNNDLDGDSVGDICDDDIDGDGFLNANDCDDFNASVWRNDAFRDADMDGFNDGTGEASPCFGDTVPAGWTLNATLDNCPGITNMGQEDWDGDGMGDLCDPDIDDDGFLNDVDCDDFNDAIWRTEAYPDADMDGLADGPLRNDAPCFGAVAPTGWTLNPELDLCLGFANAGDNGDLDGDGLGDPCDLDTDGDMVDDNEDCAPNDITRWRATAFPDFDNDGLNDGTGEPSPCFGDFPPPGWTLNAALDRCPGYTSTYNDDPDGDGLGNPCDLDDDGNGVPDGPDCSLDQTTIWTGAGGPFEAASNWTRGTPALGLNPEIAVLDATIGAFPDFETTRMLSDLSIGALVHANADFTLDLFGFNLHVDGFEDVKNGAFDIRLGVDECVFDMENPFPMPEDKPVLRLVNDSSIGSTLSANALTVGGEGPADLVLIPEEDLQLHVASSLIVGDKADGEASLLTRDARLFYGGGGAEPADIVVGHNAVGVVNVFAGEIASVDPADPFSPIDRLVVANGPGSEGRINLDGPLAIWDHDGQETIFGREGAATISVLSGAELRTRTVGSDTTLAELEGSSVFIEIEFDGARWENSEGFLQTGLGDVEIRIGTGGTLDADTILGPTAMLRGDGTVADRLVNSGEVVVGDRGDAAASTLTIQGQYVQLDDPLNPQFSGRLVIDLADDGNGNTVTDQLLVTQGATLAGSLVVESQGGLNLAENDGFVVLDSDATVSGAFDVAFFPGIADQGLFLRLGSPGAPGASALGTGAVSIVVDALDSDIDLDPSASATSLASLPTAAVLGDLDNANGPDLVITIPDDNDPEGANGSVLILFNAGSPGGTWAGFTGGTIQIPVGADPSAVDLADLDNNGTLDIAVANRADGTVSFVLNDGSITGEDLVLSVNASPEDLELVDLDGDNRPDVLVGGADGLGNGLLTARLNIDSPAPGWDGAGPNRDTSTGGPRVIAIDCGDLDDDKIPDVAAVDADEMVYNAANQAGGQGPDWDGLLPGPGIPVGAGAIDLRVGDLDLDGLLDIATANSIDGTFSILLGTGAGAFTPSSDIPAGPGVRSLVLSDLDGDGDLDIAAVTDGPGSDRQVVTFRNDLFMGALAFAIDETFTALGDPALVLAGDVDDTDGDDVVSVGPDSAGGGAIPPFGLGSPPFGINGLLSEGPPCVPDFGGAPNGDPDGSLDFNDVVSFLIAFSTNDPRADLAPPMGVLDFNDVIAYLTLFSQGCP